jgi:hypothetical protein
MFQFSFIGCTDFDNESIDFQNQELSNNISKVNKEVLSLDLSGGNLSEKEFERIRSSVGLEAKSSSFSYSEAMEFKNFMVGFLNGGRSTSDVRFQNFSIDKNIAPHVKNVYSIILKGISEKSSYDDVKKNYEKAFEYANTIRDAKIKRLLTQQIEQTQSLSVSLADKYENNASGKAWVKCKWYQWVCVAGAAAVILGSVSVAAVAACFICRCKCSFADSCS